MKKYIFIGLVIYLGIGVFLVPQINYSSHNKNQRFREFVFVLLLWPIALIEDSNSGIPLEL